MSEPTLVMKLTALRDYVMVLGVSEDDCEVFDEAVEAIVSARSAALEEAARVADARADQCAEGYAERGQFFRPDPHREAEHIAKSIRSLKDKDTRTPTEGDLL